MKKLHFKGIFRFVAGQNKSEKVYCGLMKSAMDYKYKEFAGTFVEMKTEDLAINPVFEFKEKDKIVLGPTNTVLDGKKLRELFVTTIFAKYLDSLEYLDDFEIKGKEILIGFTEQDTGTDTAIFISNSILAKDGEKFFRAIAGKSSLNFFIQVKEYFSYEEFKAKIVYPKDFTIDKLNVSKLKSYSELILVYVRSFTRINFYDVKKDLEANGLGDKSIILIGTIASEELPKEYTFWDFKRDIIYTTPIPFCNLFVTA